LDQDFLIQEFMQEVEVEDARYFLCTSQEEQEDQVEEERGQVEIQL
jgi:hypothetical protein